MGTPLLNVVVVANVWRARWKVRFFLIPDRSAISFRYEFSFWLLIIGRISPFGSLFLYLSRIILGISNNGTLTSVPVFTRLVIIQRLPSNDLRICSFLSPATSM